MRSFLINHGDLFTFPLAGSRPRGKTPEEDQALEDELQRLKGQV